MKYLYKDYGREFLSDDLDDTSIVACHCEIVDGDGTWLSGESSLVLSDGSSTIYLDLDYYEDWESAVYKIRGALRFLEHGSELFVAAKNGDLSDRVEIDESGSIRRHYRAFLSDDKDRVDLVQAEYEIYPENMGSILVGVGLRLSQGSNRVYISLHTMSDLEKVVKKIGLYLDRCEHSQRVLDKAKAASKLSREQVDESDAGDEE